MDDHQILKLQAGYDTVATEYVARIFDELKDKPLDRQLLDRFATRTRDAGPVCDLGCGPGHVARYLYERSVDVFGGDLSAGMVERARDLNPGIEFRQGNMLSLEAADEAWGAIVAFYSIIHIPRSDVPHALREMRRVLRPGGLLFLAFHEGDHIVHLDQWWGHEVSLDFVFFGREEMEDYLTAAGFTVEESITREPYPEVEHPSRRVYIVSQR